MTELTQEQFTKLVGGYGFEKFEDGAASEFKNALLPMLHSSVGQAGGRVTMPGEYFGMDVKSSVYTSNPSGTHPSMALVTDSVARPDLPQTFPLSGGAESTMDEMFETLLKQYRLQTGGKLRLKKEQKEGAKNMFRGLVNNLFENIRKVAKKTKLLKTQQMSKALKKMRS